MNQKVTIGLTNKQDINITYDEHSARYIGEVLQRGEYQFIKDELKDKKDLVIVDIGANIGTFSLYVYDIAKTIYSIEPFKEINTMLEQTVKDNKLDKIKVFSMAIGPFTGKGLMGRNEPVSAGGSSLSKLSYVENSKLPGTTAVDVMTLNDFCDKQGIDHIDVLKIDCEGGELDIMQFTDFKKLRVDYIVGELHIGHINKYTFFSVVGSQGFKGNDIDGLRFTAKHI